MPNICAEETKQPRAKEEKKNRAGWSLNEKRQIKPRRAGGKTAAAKKHDRAPQ